MKGEKGSGQGKNAGSWWGELFFYGFLLEGGYRKD
jgi:hypothetical protein